MPYRYFLWDVDDDPDGNVQHCLDHGVTKGEVEEVFQDRSAGYGTSRSSGLPSIFGDTRAGRYLIVVYEEIDDETVRPITAYDVDRQVQP